MLNQNTFLCWADGKAYLLYWQFAEKWKPYLANPCTAGNQEKSKNTEKIMIWQKNEDSSYLELV